MDRSLDVGVGRCARWSVYGISIQGGEPPNPWLMYLCIVACYFVWRKRKRRVRSIFAKGTVIVKFQVLVNQD
jgi:hypothetical protein